MVDVRGNVLYTAVESFGARPPVFPAAIIRVWGLPHECHTEVSLP